jgi:two-component system phosphate regulon sensor histidine kinase PhoR
MWLPRGFSRLFWKLFLGYAVLMALALVACVLLIIREFEQFHAEELRAQLRARALVLGNQVRGRFEPAQAEELDRLAHEVGDSDIGGMRVTFIAADGTVRGDSQADAARMDSHHDREEVRAAREHGWGASTRWSGTLARRLEYVAVRVGDKTDPEGVVRLALAVQTIGARTQSVRRIIWTIALVALTATVVFAFGLARLWTMPIRRITVIARRLSRGDFSTSVRVRGSDELAGLARSLNDMRDHLREQLGTIDRQRRTLEALLNQLQEGVIVAGPDGRIILANPAAARLLQPERDPEDTCASWVGRAVEQCVSQHDLQRLLVGDEPVTARPRTPIRPIATSKSVSADNTSEREVRLGIRSESGPVVLMARAIDIALPGPAARGAEPGAVPESLPGRILALTDITEIDRTVQMKTDFVANASHELRTPLSAIRAAIETAMGLDLARDTATAQRFLGVINRHSARLEALVADLLALSRLESPATEPKSEPIDLQTFCKELRNRWNDAAARKQVQWVCEAVDDLREVEADEQLLVLVLDNLVDNALKFTPAGGRVDVNFHREGADLVFDVADTGCGIALQDQERVFERFYQVASSRSRADGPPADARGTGLGLAIVRHAVAAMEGTVQLTSTPGAGTRVTVRIPHAGLA